MPKAIDNRNPEDEARDWMATLFGFATSNMLQSERGEGRPKPLWKQFDDTHRWDSAAEEWVPNDPT